MQDFHGFVCCYEDLTASPVAAVGLQILAVACAAEESYNPDGLMPRIIMAVKDAFPDALVMADVALDPYSTSGHDGVVDEETGAVLNDMTVYQICKQVGRFLSGCTCYQSLRFQLCTPFPYECRCCFSLLTWRGLARI